MVEDMGEGLEPREGETCRGCGLEKEPHPKILLSVFCFKSHFKTSLPIYLFSGLTCGS